MPKLATPLTDTQIKNLKLGDKPKKYSDGGGLYLHVYPTGSKLWQMDYRYYGRRNTLSFGAYPAIALKDARGKRDNAKKLLANGIDPSEYKKKLAEDARKAEEGRRSEVQVPDTFKNIAMEWHAKQGNIWTERHAKRILIRLINYIFPLLGDRAIKTIEAHEILDALHKIEDRGAIDTAHRALQNCSQIFRYAILTDRAERNPTDDLRDALPPVKRTNFASITEPKEICYLLRDIDIYKGNIVVKAALRLAPYVFVRPGELRRAEWHEIDIDNAEWRISASKMKRIHLVPLARQAVEILKELNPYTGHSQYVFPSMRTNSAPISDMALLSALRRMGYGKERMTVHGFRSMASTLLNELGYNRDWIERQLAYGDRNSISTAYNYADYLPERQRMMQDWADYLDAIKAKKWGTVFAYRYIKPRVSPV